MKEKDLYESMDSILNALGFADLAEEAQEEFMSLVRDLTNPHSGIDAQAVVRRWVNDHTRSALQNDRLRLRVVED